MEVTLRQPRARLHPLYRPASRYRVGIGYTEPPDCTPTTPGAIPNPGCIAEQARIQQENMAEHDEGQRQTFLDDCNRDWTLNDQQYAALGLPRPANQCAAIYPADMRGAANPVQLAPMYLPPPQPAAAPVPAPVSARPPITETYTAAAPAPTPAGGSAAANPGTQSAIDFLGGTVAVAGNTFPMWGVILAAGAVLYFATRGK